jgi:pimeloyl-ACP methyl ester carboxylesterase
MPLIDIDWAGRPVRIEYAFVGADDAPLAVFLHEGLGSLAMWKDFPQQLCEAAGLRGLVYSRPGYGRSTPRAPDETWGVDFMHRQAFEVLPALLRALGLWDMGEPYTLIGHSDGGSIALLHAARFADQVNRCVVLAPHIFVEDLSVASIEQARVAYEQGDLKKGLAKYHDDPDSAFYGWNGIWLNPAFRRWRIGTAVQALRCPVLAVQGLDDVYGTLEQIRGIQRLHPATQLLELPACGHSPHRDQPAALIQAVDTFLKTHGDTA